MANIIFYSTGEIFWVNDPPEYRREHIGVPVVFPPVPPEDQFTYSIAARTLEAAGHVVVGAYGRQRKAVRDLAASPGFRGDPQFLGLGSLDGADRTVLVLITTETGTPEEGGVDFFQRIPFTPDEIEAFARFRAAGGGTYVMWDHGQLGYESLKALGLEGPVAPEPDEPYRPNTAHSNDSTDSAKILVKGRRLTGDGPVIEDVALSTGPPAGYLQKIVPATLLYRHPATGAPAPQSPHPIFNGVGGSDGIWIPAHMHEGILKAKVVQLHLDESEFPADVKTLAVHIPLNETSFNSFAVMAYQDAVFASGADGRKRIVQGSVIWDTSFHHLVDINWAPDGRVPWEPSVTFSSEGLWQRQFTPEVFQQRLERGIKRLLVNAIRWLSNELPYSPKLQRATIDAKDPRGGPDFDEELSMLKSAQVAAPQDSGVVF